MGKKRSVDAKLARLTALRKEPASSAVIAELCKFLGDASNFVAAEAAAIIGKAKLVDLAPDLAAAFDRFMIDPEETDKICRAKIALIEALNQLDYDRPEIFLRAIRHVQYEPVWGGRQDTAAPLRAAAAFGLVRLNHRDILTLLADLLADPEKGARIAAVQALDVLADTSDFAGFSERLWQRSELEHLAREAESATIRERARLLVA